MEAGVRGYLVEGLQQEASLKYNDTAAWFLSVLGVSRAMGHTSYQPLSFDTRQTAQWRQSRLLTINNDQAKPALKSRLPSSLLLSFSCQSYTKFLQPALFEHPSTPHSRHLYQFRAALVRDFRGLGLDADQFWRRRLVRSD